MVNLIGALLSDPLSLVITLIVSAVTFYLAKLYYKVLSLPPGPLPLPIFGNLLSLRGTKDHVSIELIKYYKKYGPILTFWIGSKPIIFLFDYEISRETFKRKEFSGRPLGTLGQFLSNEKYSDIFMADYGPQLDTLRRVGHNALRNYAFSDKLAYLICDVVDDTVNAMIKKEGINKPFVPFTEIYLISFNILTASAFGKRYAIDDPEFLFLKANMSELLQDDGDKLAMIEFFPILRLYYWNLFKRFENRMPKVIALIQKKFTDHMKDYDDGNIRDLCDYLISAKNEALKENNESAQYLTDENLSMVIFDLFLAGIDGPQLTFKWSLLLMANFPEMQSKIRQEIDSVIGDRMPVHDDKNRCHFIHAFICESMRFKPVTPVAAFHKNLIQTKIGDQNIPAESTIFYNSYFITNDPKYWTDPEVFNPNRFLENGKFVSQKPPAFIPFGTGRRICIGERLAMNNIFLTFVRFIQMTNGYMISLPDGPGSADLNPVPNTMDFFMPKEFEIIFQKI